MSDNEGFGKFNVGILVRSLFLVSKILMNNLPVLVEGPRSEKSLAAQVARDGVLMVLEVGLVRGIAVETLVALVTGYLLPITHILMDFEVCH